MEPSPIFNLIYHLVAFSGVDSFLLIVIPFCGYGTTSSSLMASVVSSVDFSSVDFSSAVLCPLGSVSSVTQLCLTLCDPIDHSTSSFPVCHHSWSLFTLLSIKSLMPSNYLIFCHPLLLLTSILPESGSFPVSHLFSSGGQSIGSFSFNISTSIEYSGLISFSIDWFDLFTVQGTLKSLLNTTIQHL